MGFERTEIVQPELADEFEKNIETLPGSMLFAGKRGSGRLTAALDLAFSLCGEKRESTASINIVYIPSRALEFSFRSAESLALEIPDRNRVLYYRDAVLRILLQYHPSLSDLHREKSMVKKKIDGDGSIYDAAREADRLMKCLDYEDTVKIIRDISGILTKQVISMGKKTPGPSIDEIRAIDDFLRTGKRNKCAIIEGLEWASDGARNALLKLLEEPYENSYIIVISERPSLLPDTILSRLRKFTFPPIPKSRVNLILSQYLSVKSEYSSFDDFIFKNALSDGVSSEIDKAVRIFSDALIKGEALSPERQEEIFGKCEEALKFGDFSLRVVSYLEGEMLAGRLTASEAFRLNKIMSDEKIRSEIYNMGKRNSLDLALRESRWRSDC